MDPELRNTLLIVVPNSVLVVGFVNGVLLIPLCKEGDMTPLIPVSLGAAVFLILSVVGSSLYVPTSTVRAPIKSVSRTELQSRAVSTVQLGEAVFSVQTGLDDVEVGQEGVLKRYSATGNLGGVQPSEACFKERCYPLLPDTWAED